MAFTVTLLGCDGSTWNLTDPKSPVQIAQGGLGGMHLPKVTHRWATTARRSGRTWKGSVTDARSFDLAVNIGGAQLAGTDWRTLDAGFWEALSTDELATLVVNGERSLDFRLDEDNDTATFSDEPGMFGLVRYAVSCIADRPEWLGRPVTQTFTFQAADTTNYYGDTAGFGPPFYIARASLFSQAAVANPGDYPAPVVWTATGPADAFRVGVPGHVIQPPFALQSGDVVSLDSEAETISDPSGNSLWPLMGHAPVDFAPIPTGDGVPLAIGMDHPGVGASISVSFTPRFRRAWGVTSGSELVAPGGGSGGSSAGLGDMPLGDGPLGD